VTTAPLLIGLTGRAGAGKSTVAAYLEDEFAFVEIAFADPIVDMIGALFNAADISGAWMVERTLKEQPTTLGYSYRQLAQTLGTEWGRSLTPDFWLRVAAQRLDKPHLQGENIVISDVRFPNEAAWLQARGGHLVRVVREISPAVRTHESEAHADHLPAVTELLNFGSKPTLFDQVDRLITTLRS
jgi:hypothetical protein